TVLPDQCVAFYLGGSLALGDFHPQHSDIDFVAVTSGELAPAAIAALRAMHEELWGTGMFWLRKLDGSYVPRHVIRQWNASHTPCPFVERDTFTVTQQGSALIQRQILYDHGITVAGPDPRQLLDSLEPGELRRGLHEMLERWWRPLLDNPDWIQPIQNQPFAILSLCRALYTLEHGVVASKPVAASWAQQVLDVRYMEPIAWALAWPREMSVDQLDTTLDLIRYTLERYARYDERAR
ncbi:MAG TPA: aminoglycoside adenylyltransferase domain-containing protein, partial [Roseiflexaceae bacterium]|nr:aminoglycoside adenylyltransferase domain-containing protein [Roseiflexaceae bacterium]